MANTTQDIFGSAGDAAADPGTYGEAPRGFRLPNETRLGTVRLRIANLARSVEYYENVLGLRVLERSDGRASLGPQGNDRALLALHEQPGARPVPRRGRLGLFHFAILLPSRTALGGFVRHLADAGVQAGAGDHLVSEAFYLQDPDGLGIEVYADRPRETWRRVGLELKMATDPVDVAALLSAAGDAAWDGMPAGTVIGHIHLHVGSIEKSAAFFSEALGFDRMVWNYPGALFLGAGGYHHHLGTNTWAGPGAEPARDDEAGLREWTIELPGTASLVAAEASLCGAGYGATREGAEVVTADPWGTAIRLRIATP